MSKLKTDTEARISSVLHFSLTGLILFSVALVGASSFIGYRITALTRPRATEVLVTNPNDKSQSLRTGPWGTLLTRNFALARPVEHLTEEVSNPQAQLWTFKGMPPDAVKSLLAQNGLDAGRIAEVSGPDSLTETALGTEIRPSEKFLLSLDAKTRGKLYGAFAGKDVNLYLDHPWIFPGRTIEAVYQDAGINPDDLAHFKQLVYSDKGIHQFSDVQFLMSKIPTVARRVALARSISRQSAVLAGLVIKPDTDIDKIAAYWGNVPNVRFADSRPLLEGFKSLPEGGILSLMFFLPKFARERLYTFPLPPEPGDATMDCHWTTFNFANATLENRFNDPNFLRPYILSNYYKITTPSQFGDIVLLVNDKIELKHSAVYLADDVVFTKNGMNYRQPWMLMRIPDLLAAYPSTTPLQIQYMRRKTE